MVVILTPIVLMVVGIPGFGCFEHVLFSTLREMIQFDYTRGDQMD